MFRLALATVGAIGLAGTANAEYCHNREDIYPDYKMADTGGDNPNNAYNTVVCGQEMFGAYWHLTPPFYVCMDLQRDLSQDECPEGWAVVSDGGIHGYDYCKLNMIKNEPYGCGDTDGNFCPAGQQPVNGVCACADRAACNFKGDGACVYPGDAGSEAACTLTGDGGRSFLITKKVLGKISGYKEAALVANGQRWSSALNTCAKYSDDNNRFVFVEDATETGGAQWLYCQSGATADSADTSRHIVGNSIYTSYEVTEVCRDQTACNFGSDGACVFPVDGVCATAVVLEPVTACADRAACNFEAAGTCVYPGDAGSEAACTLTGDGGRSFLITKKVLGKISGYITSARLYGLDTWGPALDTCAQFAEDNRFGFVEHVRETNNEAQWMYCQSPGATDNADTSNDGVEGDTIYTSYEVTEVCRDRTACNFGSDGACVFPGDAGSDAACTLTGATGRTFLITTVRHGQEAHPNTNRLGYASFSSDETFAEALDSCAAAAVHGDGSFAFVQDGTSMLYCYNRGISSDAVDEDGYVLYEVKEVCQARTACNFEGDGACVFPGTTNSDAACTITSWTGRTFRITAIVDGTKGYTGQDGSGENPRWKLADAIDHDNWDVRCKTNRPESADLTLIRDTGTTVFEDGQWGCGSKDETAAGTNSAYDAGVFITYDVKQVCPLATPYLQGGVCVAACDDYFAADADKVCVRGSCPAGQQLQLDLTCKDSVDCVWSTPGAADCDARCGAVSAVKTVEEAYGGSCAQQPTHVCAHGDGTCSDGQSDSWEECQRLKDEYDKPRWVTEAGGARLAGVDEDGEACCLDNPADECFEWSQEYRRLTCCGGNRECDKVSCKPGYRVVGDECAQSCELIPCPTAVDDDGNVDWANDDSGALRATCVLDDLASCESGQNWFDGCNTCTSNPNGGLPMCTMNYCLVYATAECRD